MILTTHEASVTTATVEIRTLTINGKQVTLAVFRQLPESPVLDCETGEFLGRPWGTVNYHPDKCQASSAHLHVVWEKDGQLFRALTRESWLSYRSRVLSFANQVVDNAVGLACLGRADRWSTNWAGHSHNGKYFHSCETLSLRRVAGPTSKIPYELATICEESLPAASPEEVDAAWKRFCRLDDDVRRVKEEWDSSYRLLSALPQLFIAV